MVDKLIGCVYGTQYLRSPGANSPNLRSASQRQTLWPRDPLPWAHNTTQPHSVALAEWLIRRLHNGGSHLKYPFWYRMRKVDKSWTNTDSNNFPAVYLNVLTKHRTGGLWWVTKTGEQQRRTEVVICRSVWHTRGTMEWHLLIEPENLKARYCSKFDYHWVYRSAVINPLRHSGSTIGGKFRRCLGYNIVFRRTIFRGVN